MSFIRFFRSFDMLKLLWNATFGPQLYRRLRSSDAAGRPPATYNPNFLERQGGNLLLAWSFVYNLSILLSPILIPYMYRKGTVNEYVSLTSFIMKSLRTSTSSKDRGGKMK